VQSATAALSEAQHLVQAGSFAAAVEVLEDVVDREPTLGVQYLLAVACLELGEDDKALRYDALLPAELIAELAKSASALETRGEFVLVIGPPAASADTMGQDDLDELLRSALKRDSVKDAVAHAVEVSGRPRREIYARALELARQDHAGDGDAED